MTRAPATRPLVRLVTGLDGDLVAEVTDRGVRLRPKRSRSHDAVVFVSWTTIYERGLMARERWRSDERRRLAVELYRQGYSLEAVGRMLAGTCGGRSVSRQRVQQLLIEVGEPRRPRGSRSYAPRARPDAPQKHGTAP